MEATKQEHTMNDKAFTLQIKTNDKHYVEEGGAPEACEHECGGYMLFMFTEDGNCLAAQGMTNVSGMMEQLLRIFPVEKLKKALEGAIVRKMLNSMFEKEGN